MYRALHVASLTLKSSGMSSYEVQGSKCKGLGLGLKLKVSIMHGSDMYMYCCGSLHVSLRRGMGNSSPGQHTIF